MPPWRELPWVRWRARWRRRVRATGLLPGGWRVLLDREGLARWEASRPLGLLCWWFPKILQRREVAQGLQNSCQPDWFHCEHRSVTSYWASLSQGPWASSSCDFRGSLG